MSPCLSYDLVNSTELMRSIGSENYSLLLSDFHAEFAAIAQNWDAVIDRPQGDDGSMCYFGLNAASEHAQRAALLAGLRMRDVASAKGWKVRIGIASGWVAVDSGQPVGLSIHLAARFQKLARPNSVMVSLELAERYASEFEFQHQANETLVKGFSGFVSMVELVSLSRQSMVQVGDDHSDKQRIFVGRRSLLAQLDAAWLAASDGRGGDVLIQGPPGIGKSALINHWRSSRKHVNSFALHCGAHDYRRPFSSLTHWIAREIGFVSGEYGDIARNMLSVCLAHHPDWKPLHTALEYLFDVARSEDENLFEDKSAQHQQALQALKKWVIERTHKQALLLIIEDYQWMDASSVVWVEQLRQAINAGQRILLIVTQRTDSRQAYVAQNQSHTLEPLSDLESHEVMAATSPELFSDSRLRALVAERAQGIPLFLCESIRLFKSPEYREKLHTAQRLGIGLPIPETIQELLMRRMDQLGSSRAMAQIGSVLGQEFPQSMMFAVVDALKINLGTQTDRRKVCENLISEGIWRESDRVASPTWCFTHAMLRDAAYQSMWETDRKRIHAIAAQVMGLMAARGEEEMGASDLARHLAASGQIEAAIDRLIASGKRSKRRGAHQVAVQTLEESLSLLALLPESTLHDRRYVEAHLLLAGQKLVTQGYGSSAVEDHFFNALRTSQFLKDHQSILRAQFGIQSCQLMRGDFNLAWQMLEAAQETAQHVNSPLSTLQCDWARANLLFYEGRMHQSARLMQACVDCCEQHKLGQDLIQNPHVMAMMYQAFAHWCMGDVDVALTLMDKGRLIANQSVHRLARVQAHGIAAMIEYGCGRWKRAMDAAVQAMASCQPGEYGLWYAHAGVMQGAALAQLGQVDQGLAMVRSNHERWVAHGGTLSRSYYWAIEAEIQLVYQDAQAALTTLNHATRFLQDIPERYYDSEIQRLTLEARMQMEQDLQSREHFLQQMGQLHSRTCAAGLHGLADRVALAMRRYALSGDHASATSAAASQARSAKVIDLNRYPRFGS